MKHQTRACIAYIAGRLLTKWRPKLLFDPVQSKHLIIKGKVRKTGVYVHDFSRNCFITGDGKDGSYTLYDQGGRHHVSLKIEDGKFSGYDHGTRTAYNGRVEEDTVKLFDFEDNRLHSFKFTW